MLNFFDVTADGGLSYNHLVEREFIENGSLSSVIHANDDNLVLLAARTEL